MGTVSAYISLAFGLFFFTFAAKYYLSVLIILLARGESGQDRMDPVNSHANHNRRMTDRFLRHFNNQLDSNHQGRKRNRDPLVSIHLPFYNEKNVAERILKACTNLDYKNYEVIVVDDSRDETLEIIKEWSKRRGPPVVKFVHRNERKGFKGGALSEALKHTDPRAMYVIVFDADFMPPPDIIQQFLWYFEMACPKRGQNSVNNCNNYRNHNNRLVGKILRHFYKQVNNNCGSRELSPIDEVRAWDEHRRVAAVQGYQLHCLNKDENWITRGVRVEYSGSYTVERVAEEFFGAMKMIAGSVFMIRADLLRKHGWSTSLTEDWELTIRLYLEGYKVVYSPLVQAAAEIPSTIRRLVRQRMRWAEGHTFAVKKYFWRVLGSPMLSLREKLEFLYFAPYYLQSFFFVLGTSFWVLSEFIHRYVPFWLAAFGWVLVLSNMISLPLMGLAGLFMESSARRDFIGIFSIIVLSYVLAPFQAWAALKGLIEKQEGVWFRTPKTGRITELIVTIRLRKVLRWILPGKTRRSMSERRKARKTIREQVTRKTNTICHPNFVLERLRACLVGFRRASIRGKTVGALGKRD